MRAAAAVLATKGLPRVVLVGGLAITTRIALAGQSHRATTDIDLVTAYQEPEPEAFDLLVAAHDAPDPPLVVEGIKVDVIPTAALDEFDVTGLTDDDRLFLTGHRWAYERAEPVTLTAPDSDLHAVTMDIALTPGLIATKAHAAGYPRAQRRAEKHASDLLDLYRLIAVFDVDGSAAAVIRSGPPGLAHLVADVCDHRILDNPAAAARAMATASLEPIERADVADSVGDFVAALRA